MFILIDGLDSSGKTTIAKHLCEKFQAEYVPMLGGSELGKNIRKMMLDSKPNMSATSIFLTALFAVVECTENKIKPLIEKGINVVVDRSIASNLAYNLYSVKELDPYRSELRFVYDFFNTWLNKEYSPTIFIYAEVSREVAKLRLQERSEENNHLDYDADTIKELRRLAFDEYFKTYPYLKSRINCDNNLETVLKDAEAIIKIAIKAHQN